MLNKIKKLRGFTLIELIIVIAIIAILAAIAVPAFGQIRQKANISSDVANARSIYSLVATEIASDKVTLPTGNNTQSYWLNNVGGANIGSLIEPTPVVKTYQNSVFIVTLDKDGKIQIDIASKPSGTSSGTPTKIESVYPTASGTKYGSN